MFLYPSSAPTSKTLRCPLQFLAHVAVEAARVEEPQHEETEPMVLFPLFHEAPFSTIQPSNSLQLCRMEKEMEMEADRNPPRFLKAGIMMSSS